MDRHIKALWARLGGVSTTRRVHWVRGSLMGIGGHAIYGMCLGSRPGEQPADAEGLTLARPARGRPLRPLQLHAPQRRAPLRADRGLGPGQPG